MTFAKFRALFSKDHDKDNDPWYDNHCVKCGAEVLWVELIDNNERVPVDSDTVEVVVVDGSHRKGASRQATLSHYDTCPLGAEFYKRGAK